MKAALYARISLDRQDGAGVGRQIEDCRAHADRLGWEIVGEYVDNDISAFNGKRRPEYRRLLADLEAGTVDAVVAYHSNRLYRLQKELTEFVDLVVATKAEVSTVMSGHYDLSTAAGRKRARDAGSDAQYESEVLGERVARERKSRAASGKPGAGGMRPFGYSDDKVTIVPAEAELIRAAALRVAAGGSMFAEAKAWNAAGARTTTGKEWEVSAIRRVLSSPRIAGLRTYKGEVVGEAVWPAIIDRDTHERILAMTVGRRRGRARASSWLLSALIACPKCSRPLYGSMRGTYRAYACAPSVVSGRGCGGASVSADAVEAKVLGQVRDWLANPPKSLTAWLAGGNVEFDTEAELVKIKDRRAELTRQYALDNISTDELNDALTVLAARRVDLEGSVPAPRAPTNLREILAAWDTGTVEDKRAVIEAYVHVPMALSSERLPNPADRLTITPKWDVVPPQ